jgi:transcriptional regulator with XRE-family HTH domain
MSRRRRLAQRRRLVGCSQEHLAERLGVDRSTVVRWEAGETEPSPWLRPRLARALRISFDALDELIVESVDGNHKPDGSRANTRRREQPGIVTVAQLSQTLQDLDDRYDLEPSAALVAEAGECLGAIGLLQAQAKTSRARRDLLALEAEAAAFMGLLVWDASHRRDQVSARAHFQRSRTAAQRLGHPAAEALAVLRLCFVALYGDKDTRAGLTLAQQAAELAHPSSPVLAGLAALHAAEAHATLDQGRDCKQALLVAERQFDRVRADDPAADWFTPSHYDRLAGSCWLSLGRYEDAEAALEATVRMAPTASKARAIALGNLAQARLGQRRVGDATDTLHEAIDVIETTRGGGGFTVVFAAARRLRPWDDDPRVRDVNDRLFSVIAPN